MQRTDFEGIWSVFVKDVKEWDSYKYRLEDRNGNPIDKADPYAFYAETRPETASKTYNLEDIHWHDASWMKARKIDYHAPMNIYEVYAGGWKKNGEFPYTYEMMEKNLIPYVKKNGYTHIEFMPLNEYPFDGSWGYQASGYYAVTSRYGNPTEFASFVNACHENGIGVIMDMVPVHFVKDAFGLCSFDGEPLYEYAKKEDAESQWGTLNFNLWKEEVRSFLMSAAAYWCDVYHMQIIYRYERIKEDPNYRMPKHTYIFAAKAASSYTFAKKVIKLINNVANVVNNDPDVKDMIKVVFLPNYNVSMAEVLVPGTDVSEQISTAGKEASGTGCMKFMPIYLNALSGKGAHVITVNEYLADRDAKWMGDIYRFLGLSVGCNLHSLSPMQKKEAYACDITYTTNSELGFDYLRDNMVMDPRERVLRGLHYAVLDEVDSILIDEAQTPLIISGPGEVLDQNYLMADRFVKGLKNDTDFTIDAEDRSASLTEKGIQKAEKAFKIENIYNGKNAELVHYIQNALRANYIMPTVAEINQLIHAE